MGNKKVVVHKDQREKFLENIYLCSKTGAEAGAYEGIMRAKVEILEIDNNKEKLGELPMTKTDYKKEKKKEYLYKFLFVAALSLLFKWLGFDDSLLDLIKIISDLFA